MNTNHEARLVIRGCEAGCLLWNRAEFLAWIRLAGPGTLVGKRKSTADPQSRRRLTVAISCTADYLPRDWTKAYSSSTHSFFEHRAPATKGTHLGKGKRRGREIVASENSKPQRMYNVVRLRGF